MDFRDKKLGEWKRVNSSLKSKDKRIREIDGILHNYDLRKANWEVHNQYVKIHWNIPKELYRKKHANELEAYNKANRYIRVRYSDGKVTVKSLKEEKSMLESDTDNLGYRKENMKDEVSQVRKIDSILRKIRPEIFEEVEKKKESVGEKKKPDEKVNAVEQRTPVTDDSKGSVSDKDKPVKPEERPSVLEKMKMRKKEIDQKERAERSRGYRVIKHDRDEPSL